MAKLDKITLPKGHKLIVTADVYSSGRFYEDLDQQTTSATTISPSETKIVTEDYSDRNFVLVSDTGRLTYEVRLDLDDQDSSEVPYDNSVSGLSATTIKGAIDELAAAPGTDDQTAAEVPYDNSSSGLAATDTQAAIDEVESRVDTLEAAPAPTADLDTTINQAGHGLTVGQPIKLTGTVYLAAQADSSANAEVIGLVTEVIDTDNFKHRAMFGRVTGLSGLTAGEVYWLDPTTAGAITTTEPTATGTIKKAILVADTTTSGYLKDHPGIIND